MMKNAYGDAVKVNGLFWKGSIQQVSLDTDDLVKTRDRLVDSGFTEEDFVIRPLTVSDVS